MLDPLLIFCFFLGGIAHLLGTLIEESKKSGKKISLKYFVELHPYQLGLSLVFSVAAYIFLFKMGQLNEVAALAAGYMGDSIVKKAMSGVNVKADKP